MKFWPSVRELNKQQMRRHAREDEGGRGDWVPLDCIANNFNCLRMQCALPVHTSLSYPPPPIPVDLDPYRIYTYLANAFEVLTSTHNKSIIITKRTQMHKARQAGELGEGEEVCWGTVGPPVKLRVKRQFNQKAATTTAGDTSYCN